MIPTEAEGRRDAKAWREYMSKLRRKECGIPTFHSWADRRDLLRRWGLPNSAPTPAELAKWGQLAFLRPHTRDLFVDDDRDGEPVAYWQESKRARWAHRRACRLRAMAAATEFDAVARRLVQAAAMLERIS